MVIAGESKVILNETISTLVHMRETGTMVDCVKMDGMNRDGSIVPPEMSLSSCEYKGEIRNNSVIRSCPAAP